MALTLVIFGASGDLTSRKLVPALFHLYQKKRLPADTRIVGFSRTAFSDEKWRDSLIDSTAEFSGDRFDRAAWDEFATRIHYQAGDIARAQDFESLHKRLTELEGNVPGATRVYYLATAPRFYEQAVSQLGACGLGDIGDHFPPTDDRYKNISSTVLLQHILPLIEKTGYRISNIDATIFLEKPKLGPYKQQIRAHVANLLGLSLDCVSIKAKTAEKFPPVGTQEAIAASVTLLLHQR